MDPNALADEISKVRERLTEIAEIRRQLPAEAFVEKTELLDEEHELNAHLAELRDQATKAGAGLATATVAAQSDLTRTPKLPSD